ncbi:MAG TPA: hypothetical protein VHS03_04505 [Gaiellaceae bacterium]|jgi:hypothetical protein|nr:hypothetical protein [Gaiellaceae bacterium]
MTPHDEAGPLSQPGTDPLQTPDSVPPEAFIERWTSGGDGTFGICLLCGLTRPDLPVEHGCRPNLSESELQQAQRIAAARQRNDGATTWWDVLGGGRDD